MAAAFITGISGQDGGYLAELLVEQGLVVHGLTRPSEAVPDHLARLDGLVLHEGELLDPSRLAGLLDDIAPDEVYNLAGITSVAQSWQEPVLTARVNGEAVALLLDLLWKQVERGREVRFLQASSAEIFAGSASVPQDETTPLSARSPYGAAKSFAHQLVQVYRGRGMRATNAILYNHESPRRPPTFVTRKITQTVAAIADGRAEELVLGSLEARRDWGWAPEYVDGMVRALRYAEPDDWVLATGESASVRDFVMAAFAHVGLPDWEAYVRSDAAFHRPSDAAELTGKATKAARLLGWSARVRLPELVGRMVDADRVR